MRLTVALPVRAHLQKEMHRSKEEVHPSKEEVIIIHIQNAHPAAHHTTTATVKSADIPISIRDGLVMNTVNRFNLIMIKFNSIILKYD